MATIERYRSEEEEILFMRNVAQAVLIFVGVVLLISTAVVFQKYRVAAANYHEVKSAEEKVRAQYTEAFNSIAEIQDSLDAIRIGEGAVKLMPEESGQRLSAPSREQALESIALLEASIQRTKVEISDLESRLHRSELHAAGLAKLLGQVKATLAEREARITQLSAQVDELQTRVSGLQVAVQQGQDSLSAKDHLLDEDRRDIETVYYVVGTKQELSHNGLIVAKGGVLGLGKTIQLSGTFDDHLFKPLNTADESVISTTATRARVLSAQPVSSYQLVVEGNVVQLRILNPAEFRKVKHVVIMTA